MATPFTLALLTALTIAPMAAIPQAPVSAPDVRVVVEAERAFAALAQVKGIRGSFVDSFSTDSVMISGRPSNAQEGFKTWSDGPENLTWYPQAAGISASGDLGFTYGPSVLREKADATILRHSTYISIWRRQPDGIWKVELDAGVAMPNPTNPIPGWASGNMVAKGPTPTGQAEASLRHAEALLERAIQIKGSAAYGRFGAPDLHLFRSGIAPIAGRSKATQAPPPSAGFRRWTIEKATVASSGDLGYTYGLDVITQGQNSKETTCYRIWTRGTDGAWKLLVEALIPRH